LYHLRRYLIKNINLFTFKYFKIDTHVFTENIPVITINDIRQITNQENKNSIRREKVLKLKNKIDTIIEEGVWDFDDIFQEHNYFNRNSTVFDCVVYFLSG